MAINSELTECVAFLGLKNQNTGEIECRGTAFFIKHTFLPEEEDLFTADPTRTTLDTERSACFVVTAYHNIAKARETSAEAVILQLNTKQGTVVSLEIEFDDWHFSPASETDVAVARIEWSDDWKHRALGSGFLLVESELEAMHQQFGIGEEICITGLFSSVPGNGSIQPIGRFGHIVGLNSKVKTKLSPKLMDAHLAEVHSIGGLSGSPVFVKIQYDDRDYNKEHPRVISEPYWLVAGLVHGHFDVDEDDLLTTTKSSTRNHVNTGIAVVIPSRNIRNALDIRLRDDL